MSEPPDAHLVQVAARLGIDLTTPWQRLSGLRPDEVSNVARCLGKLGPTLRAAGGNLAAPVGALRQAWSAPEPVSYLSALSAAASSAGEQVTAAAEQLTASVATVQQLKQSAAQAMRSAAVAVSSVSPAGPSGVLGYDQQALRDRERLICTGLAERLAGLVAELDALLSRLNTVLAGDPGTALPPPSAAVGARADPVSAVERRSAANTAKLNADLADPATQPFATLVKKNLADAAAGNTPVQLLGYDARAFDGQGRVAYSVGDLATADQVVMLTPGVSSSPANTAAFTAMAKRLIAENAVTAPGTSTAVIVNTGYDIPLSGFPGARDPGRSGVGRLLDDASDIAAAPNDDIARAYGPQAAADANGYLMLAKNSALTSGVGHSYGSTLTSQSAKQGAKYDTVVFLGSPGVGRGIDSASAYRSGTDRTFVIDFDGDIVTRGVTDLASDFWGALKDGAKEPEHSWGADPAGAAFGAQRVNTAPTKDERGPLGTASVKNHSMDKYTSGDALAQLSLITTGRSSRVRRRPGK
ncbi:alpha/beta hydrolase [Nakamurella aerolata]|uniref:DUF1023 domain-containing protein n=1 Tax=Nakamurella aerolata TaxID=1656892 RepID=A0A848ZZC0_9ACTN|nr:alpha/beta hydrolase [Nakamurella aerolata]NNG34164.1 hypothetical protein [Nakamurella aerolata]